MNIRLFLQRQKALSANGTVKAERTINVSPKSSGYLKRLLVQEGDRVRQGQVVAYMDIELQILKHKPRDAQPTVSFIDKYCNGYKDLFPEVRSYECFKYLHL